MRIHDILSTKGTEVVHLAPDASVLELVRLLEARNLGAVVVSADGATIAGIVSERDVIRRLAQGADLLDLPVSALMTEDVHRCTTRDSVRGVMAVMTEQRVRHVPVVDEHDRLAGIVSIGDLVKSQIAELEFERDQLEGYVSG